MRGENPETGLADALTSPQIRDFARRIFDPLVDHLMGGEYCEQKKYSPENFPGFGLPWVELNYHYDPDERATEYTVWVCETTRLHMELGSTALEQNHLVQDGTGAAFEDTEIPDILFENEERIYFFRVPDDRTDCYARVDVDLAILDVELNELEGAEAFTRDPIPDPIPDEHASPLDWETTWLHDFNREEDNLAEVTAADLDIILSMLKAEKLVDRQKVALSSRVR